MKVSVLNNHFHLDQVVLMEVIVDEVLFFK